MTFCVAAPVAGGRKKEGKILGGCVRKDRPAVDITINLLVNFHLGAEFLEASGIIYIYFLGRPAPGTHLAISARPLPEPSDVDSVAPFFPRASRRCRIIVDATIRRESAMLRELR